MEKYLDAEKYLEVELIDFVNRGCPYMEEIEEKWPYITEIAKEICPFVSTFVLKVEDGRYLLLNVGGDPNHSLKKNLTYRNNKGETNISVYDFIVNLLEKQEITAKEARIDRIEEKIYYGSIVLENANGTSIYQTRPSDAIAIALKTCAKIYVKKKVIDIAGSTEEEVKRWREKIEKKEDIFVSEKADENFEKWLVEMYR